MVIQILLCIHCFRFFTSPERHYFLGQKAESPSVVAAMDAVNLDARTMTHLSNAVSLLLGELQSQVSIL